jgi:tungstate transport system substrate-binding protein
VILRLVLLTALFVTASVPAAAADTGTVILATTTSTQDSGLLDVLVPMFERLRGATVKTIAVGTGQALALAARGEADVTLAHAPTLEKAYVADGRLRNRRLVMYNDFVIAGPGRDPARIRGETSAVAAFGKIAAAHARFASRGDRSGTHVLEQALWRDAGVTPGSPWYIESGQGMGATLGIAYDRGAYTLTDRATLLAFARRVDLKVMVEGVAALRAKSPSVFDKALQGIAALVENAHIAVERGDAVALGELMDLNQMLLAGWLLSTDTRESLCAAARDAGALGAKLTGSGGGGAMVALAGAADDPEADARANSIVEAWRALGYDGFRVTVGDQGKTR